MEPAPEQLLPMLEWTLRVDRDHTALDDLVAGESPASAEQAWDAAHVALVRQRPLDAVRLFEHAFLADPALRWSRGELACVDAAMAAAWASGLEGADESERAGMRALALEWLSADLSEQERRLHEEGSAAADAVARCLVQSFSREHLHVVRERSRLHDLPSEEVAGWDRHWAAHARLLRAAMLLRPDAQR